MSFWKSNKKKNNESDEEVLKAIGAQVPSPLGGDLVTHSPTQSSLGSLGRAGGSPKAIVAEKVTQVGSFFFDASVRIDGKLKGDLFSSGTLYIGAYAVVDAAVSVGTLVVEGVFRGSVEAADVVEIPVPPHMRDLFRESSF